MTINIPAIVSQIKEVDYPHDHLMVFGPPVKIAMKKLNGENFTGQDIARLKPFIAASPRTGSKWYGRQVESHGVVYSYSIEILDASLNAVS